jgi:hypothetical protein
MRELWIEIERGARVDTSMSTTVMIHGVGREEQLRS